MVEPWKITEHYINGEWTPATSDGLLPVANPATEEVIAFAPNGNAEDINRAVAAARAAFATWSLTPVTERVKLLRRVYEGMLSHAEEFVQTLAREMGSPVWFSRAIQLPLPLKNLELAIEAIEQMSLEEEVGHSLVVREPIGVVAAITPWNAPLHQIIAKAGAALAAGCTVVLKPSEAAPLNCVVLTQIIHDAGVPPGVFNVVFGDGPSVGEPLVQHPDIDMVSFTGSIRAGQRVAELAGQGIKKVALELGGKSATILLEDAALEKAAQAALWCFANSGQVCSAQSRLLVPRHKLAEFEALLLRDAPSWPVGEPSEPETRIGPVLNQTQHDKVRRYVESGIAEGARLIYGSVERPAGFACGHYVAPVIFSDVTPTMTIAREEIFGPVLAVMPYDSEEEAIAIANSLPYGLSGGVWSADHAKAVAIARRLQTGQVIINGAPRNLAAPFGGYKHSGIGRENGRFGVEEFFQLKAIQGGV